jgi:hypothetical protein
LAQANFRAAALVLAGQGPDAVITKIMAEIDSMKITPARRPRRRTTAADRDRAATEFLNGPACASWTAQNPSPRTEVAAAAKVNGARGGRPRKAVAS